MDIITYIILIFFAVFLLVGGYYILSSLIGPRKIEEIEKLIEQGRTREAVQQLNRLLEQDERNMQAHLLLARCHHKEGNYPNAILEYRQCIKIGKYSPEAPEISIRRSLAEALIQAGNKNDAKNEYLILTTIQPENYDNFYNVGKLFFNAGIYVKAINFLNKAITLNTNHVDSYVHLGQAQYNMGAYQDSRNSLLRAVQIKPDLKAPRYHLGLALRMTGDLEWAIKELEKAERDESVRDKAILAKGMVFIDQGIYNQAITELQKGLKYTQPASDTGVSMRYLLAMAAEKNRDIPLAIENWEKIEMMKPGYRDVKEKLRQYQEFQTDDSIKDFMIANTTQFENISRKLIENLGYQIINLNLASDSRIIALAAEEDSQKLLVRNRYTLFRIQRDIHPLSENHIREFQEKMRENNAGRGILITTGDITPGALNYASTRPLIIYDSTKIAEILRPAIEG